MKDDLTMILIESINLNPRLGPAEKIELVSQTLWDCKQKKIGKIVMDAIEGKSKPATQKRGRGRPRKQVSPYAKQMIESAKIRDKEMGLVAH